MLKCTTRRRSCANTRNTYSTWKRIVGTLKKSTETNVLAWLFRKVRQVCEGGLRCRTMYLATLVSPMVMPNLSSSPWMWGAPHRGLLRLICPINSRTSRGTAGRPGLPRRTFQVQNRRKPWRCHAITVSGRTMAIAARQFGQTRDKTTHKLRSAGVKRGRGTDHFKKLSWWRRATFLQFQCDAGAEGRPKDGEERRPPIPSGDGSPRNLRGLRLLKGPWGRGGR